MPNNPIDVGMMVYGKPYQTAVSLHTLYKHSGQHINKIYVTFEKNQPFSNESELLIQLLEGLPVEYNTSKRYVGGIDLSEKSLINYLKFSVPSFRKSIKYQYIWEKTQAPYLLILHNDMLFTGDILGYFLEKIQDDIAVGTIGQCWNCPAFEKHCDGDRYFDFRPSAKEIDALYKNWPIDRAVRQGVVGDGQSAWPMPECRINEYAVMFNMTKAKKMVFPYGSVRPFGIHNKVDFGIPWFRDISLKGIKLKHTSYWHLAEHGWCSNHAGGTPSLSNYSLYEKEEIIAKEYLENEFKLQI
jgi:hypothetical protein